MTPGIRSYRDLVAWQKGIELVVIVYREGDRLPRAEDFGLRVQLRRSAVSVPCNIAEGWGRATTREYLRYLAMARGSVYELLTQVEIVPRLGYPGRWNDVKDRAQEVGRLVFALASSLAHGRRPFSPPP